MPSVPVRNQGADAARRFERGARPDHGHARGRDAAHRQGQDAGVARRARHQVGYRARTASPTVPIRTVTTTRRCPAGGRSAIGPWVPDS
jgi:hypothetical protein